MHLYFKEGILMMYELVTAISMKKQENNEIKSSIREILAH